MSQDREDSRQQFEEGETPLLKRILFGVFAGIFVTAIEFGGLFGISSSSIWEGMLGILAAGCFRGDHRGCAALGGSGGAV